ncbi:imidazolonepropionase [Hallella colorans]|uniref:imidazolonepropionase n=1 Tax=Hallella colorans TaxID=1703337 RepID=UPI0023F04239|nr:imidazolonepropionase [Hallella colorans]
MKLLVTNIDILAGIGHDGKRCLKGDEMARIDTIEHAYLYVEDGRIASYGKRSDMPQIDSDTTVVDAEGGAVLPSFCDSHTHIVYAGSREGEFVDKIRGLSYAEIAKRGGGILNSADRLHELSEDELYTQAMKRVDEVIRKGTGAIEIKSGYGLNLEDELKMLRVIRRIKETSPVKVVANFLGAHAVGRAFAGRQKEYVDHVINDMLPAVAKENLADFIDVFCDEGFFTPDETRRILKAGAKYGLRGKIHAEELAVSGGVDVAVECDALSVDHLEAMDDHDIELLKNTNTIPTALPGTSFFLNMPFAPARKMIQAGLPMAIASDYNPGSTPSGDMKFAVSLACIKMRLMPAEAINAATLNSACAMGLSEDYGSITKGKVANFFITDPIPSIDFIPYAYTTPIIRRIFLKGVEYRK